MFLSELAVDFSSLLRIGHDDLVDYELLDNILINCVLFELKVIVSYRLTFDNLVIVEGIIELLQEWMLEYLFGSKSFLWIVGHKLADEINCTGRSIRHKLLPGLSWSFRGDLLHIFEIVLLEYLALYLFGWQTKNLYKIF